MLIKRAVGKRHETEKSGVVGLGLNILAGQRGISAGDSQLEILQQVSRILSPMLNRHRGCLHSF